MNEVVKMKYGLTPDMEAIYMIPTQTIQEQLPKVIG